MLNEIKSKIQLSIETKQKLLSNSECLQQLEILTERCLQSLSSGGKIIFAGNGGSFADAQHLSAEFTSRFMFDRAPLPSVALATNSSAMSAIGNDYGYDHVFSRELKAIAKPEDVFIPISTSGNSSNILSAVAVAKELNIYTVALTGQSGGKLNGLCECVCIPSNDTAQIQESHIMVGHILCGLIESNYFSKDPAS